MAVRISTAEKLTISEMEQWLWDSACAIRGATDAPKFKDFILPLVFFKRLSDVFDDEFSEQKEIFGDQAYQVVLEDHEDSLRTQRRGIVRFYVPLECSWDRIRNHPANGTLGEFVTSCLNTVSRLNPLLDGVLNVKDYNERQSGERILDDARLENLIQTLSRHRLGLNDASPDILGHAYEYLLRKFAEGQGQSAGEFFTPMEVGLMMGRILNPPPRCTIYDPTMGSAGLLIKAMRAFLEGRPDKRIEEITDKPEIYGQELNPTTFAMAKMNALLHGFEKARWGIGDTFRKPAFAAEGVGIQKFDRIIANPMWNQDGYSTKFYETDKWSRFKFGVPPASSADWGWAQHIAASLNDEGVATMILDTGAVSRGSGGDASSKEKTVRAAMIEADLVEAVILLPENLFYNTTAAGLVLVLRKDKPAERKNQILLINASTFFYKEKPKNVFTAEGQKEVVEVCRNWESREKFSLVIDLNRAKKEDYNLSPSAYIQVGEKQVHRDLGDIIVDLRDAKLAREDADKSFENLLARLGLI